MNTKRLYSKFMKFLKSMFEAFKAILVKIGLSIPVGLFVFRDEWFQIIFALVIVIILDTILGVWVAIKHKRFSSWRMGQTASKIGRYGLGLATVWAMVVADPSLFHWSFSTLGVFFVITEVISNFEKLALLGLELPQNFLGKINKDFLDLSKSNKKNEQKEIKKILDKRESC